MEEFDPEKEYTEEEYTKEEIESKFTKDGKEYMKVVPDN